MGSGNHATYSAGAIQLINERFNEAGAALEDLYTALGGGVPALTISFLARKLDAMHHDFMERVLNAENQQ